MRILEIGCYTGDRAYALAARGHRVLGVDLPDYYARQAPQQEECSVARHLAAAHLGRLRSAVRNAFVGRLQIREVQFVHGDMGCTSFREASFDLVASWEVLEHVQDPFRVMRETYRLLRPGGACFHKYKPFFALDGGHSLCTLDVPFGHARLSSQDLEAYVRRFRPDEAEVDLRFYHQNLNRLALADMHEICRRIVNDVLGVVPLPSEGNLRDIDGQTLRQVRANYPHTNLADLPARKVWVILARPGGPA